MELRLPKDKIPYSQLKYIPFCYECEQDVEAVVELGDDTDVCLCCLKKAVALLEGAKYEDYNKSSESSGGC